MDRAVRILSALFATMGILFVVWMMFFIVAYVVPSLPKLNTSHRDAAIIGGLLGYWLLFGFVFLSAARLLWTRRQWRGAIFLAGLAILGLPAGPVLGPVALILLTRPGVRESFAG